MRILTLKSVKSKEKGGKKLGKSKENLSLKKISYQKNVRNPLGDMLFQIYYLLLLEIY